MLSHGEVMNRTRQLHLKESKVIYPSVGSATFFVLELNNPFNQQTLFEVPGLLRGSEFQGSCCVSEVVSR